MQKSDSVYQNGISKSMVKTAGFIFLILADSSNICNS